MMIERYAMFYKALLILIFTILSFLLPVYLCWYRPKFNVTKTQANHQPEQRAVVLKMLKEKAVPLKEYTRKKGFNTTICFLIDMRIESGRKRFFVYNIQKDTVLLSGLVAHGSCDNGFQTEAAFSNKINSGCSSTGRYKIGGAYKGKFGLSYKLYGLDSCNSNAFSRSVVLHSYECVPEQETYPLPICNSRGCPMVSPGFMNQLKPVINSSGKPVLLWIFK